jgi:hypothetical protein
MSGVAIIAALARRDNDRHGHLAQVINSELERRRFPRVGGPRAAPKVHTRTLEVTQMARIEDVS